MLGRVSFTLRTTRRYTKTENKFCDFSAKFISQEKIRGYFGVCPLNVEFPPVFYVIVRDFRTVVRWWREEEKL